MIEVENTDVNIVRNLIPMRNHMPAIAYGLKAISDWFTLTYVLQLIMLLSKHYCQARKRVRFEKYSYFYIRMGNIRIGLIFSCLRT